MHYFSSSQNRNIATRAAPQRSRIGAPITDSAPRACASGAHFILFPKSGICELRQVGSPRLRYLTGYSAINTNRLARRPPYHQNKVWAPLRGAQTLFLQVGVVLINLRRLLGTTLRSERLDCTLPSGKLKAMWKYKCNTCQNSTRK